MTRDSILEQAQACVCGDRDNQYGPPEQSFQIIAEMWNAYIHGRNADLTAADVAAMMVLFKAARISTGHTKADNWIDLAGYAACGGELQEDER